MIHALEMFIIKLIEIIYQFVSSYGLSIVILTVLVKIVFYPLTKKQFVSMARMKEMAPQQKAIQAKNKSNPQQAQKEIMELYRKHKVNPLSGCAPMLVQLPFLMGLFFALNGETFNQIIHSPGIDASFLWIVDLTEKGLFINFAPLS